MSHVHDKVLSTTVEEEVSEPCRTSLCARSMGWLLMEVMLCRVSQCFLEQLAAWVSGTFVSWGNRGPPPILKCRSCLLTRHSSLGLKLSRKTTRVPSLLQGGFSIFAWGCVCISLRCLHLCGWSSEALQFVQMKWRLELPVNF